MVLAFPAFEPAPGVTPSTEWTANSSCVDIRKIVADRVAEVWKRRSQGCWLGLMQTSILAPATIIFQKEGRVILKPGLATRSILAIDLPELCTLAVETHPRPKIYLRVTIAALLAYALEQVHGEISFFVCHSVVFHYAGFERCMPGWLVPIQPLEPILDRRPNLGALTSSLLRPHKNGFVPA